MKIIKINLYKPAIVVVAFNRAKSLRRLLNSLEKAQYDLKDISLVISIDKGDNKNILKIANEFNWKNGEKEVIYQENNLGLKKHILKCGNLTEKYGSIILLEDDLYVSSQFYNYSVQSLKFYSEDSSISQISLYKYPVNIGCRNTFIPVEDNSDVFFMQYASSWGQIWTNIQWLRFQEWFSENDLSMTANDNISDFVIGWKETSWLKYFIKYNQENNKFVVYPKVSLTSNFSDAGTNVTMDNNIYIHQQTLMIEDKKYNFKKLEDSFSVYDVYFELHQIARINLNILSEYKDVEFDLYGTKKLSKIKSRYLVSIKKCNKPIGTYGRFLKPHEMNILNDIEGKELSFGRLSDFEKNINIYILKENFKYFWTHSMEYISIFYLFKIRLKQQVINIKNRLKRLL